MTAAASTWDGVGRERGELFRGGRLETTEAWASQNGGQLNEVEEAFVEASVAQREAEAARERIPREMREHIATNYPPGGTLGYVRWALDDGKITFDVPGQDRKLPHELAQTGTWFAARLVLSIGLLGTAVFIMSTRLASREGRPSED